MPNGRDACNGDVAPDCISLGLSPVPRLHLHSGSGNIAAGMNAKRFRIAFSFAGEKRNFVAEVSGKLAQGFGQEHILYDKYHEAGFTRLIHAGLFSS
ncbi:MAG: hypothetical protein NT105_09360 [Verrucomicrobia bacterium]|nr:hypothetical protein [Verrucomicrobiota bacterium]